MVLWVFINQATYNLTVTHHLTWPPNHSVISLLAFLVLFFSPPLLLHPFPTLFPLSPPPFLQGADTINWLCVAESARQFPSGSLFLGQYSPMYPSLPLLFKNIFYGIVIDRQPVSEHLPLAWSRSPDGDELRLMERLEELRNRFVVCLFVW